MSQQFLSYFDVDAESSQIRRQRMTEAMPSDLFVREMVRSDPKRSKMVSSFGQTI
jgi:hypothetical protein